MLILILFCIQATGVILSAQDTSLVAFRLKDQFDKVYTDNSWSDNVIVLIGSDRGGSAYNELWGKALHDSLRNVPGYNRIQFVGLSDLRGVPFFLKGFVRGKFPKDRESWVLMDWKGTFPKAYQFEAGASNILVFDRKKSLVYQAPVHQLSGETLHKLLTTLKALL